VKTSETLTVNPREAAARLGLGQRTVYRLLKSGQLPAIRIGSRPHFRIPLRVLEEVLAEPGRLSIDPRK
jgi:excisionase family DNA binding protein